MMVVGLETQVVALIYGKLYRNLDGSFHQVLNLHLQELNGNGQDLSGDGSICYKLGMIS